MRCAVIAAGTNSCRLLVADNTSGTWLPAYHEIRGTRLGEGLAASGELKETAIERTLAAIEAMSALARGADRTLGIGTSALRAARNAGVFAKRFEHIVNAKLDVLSGEEEACASFSGAAIELTVAGVDVTSGLCVADVGGGSTEIASGPADANPKRALSLELGAVSLTESALGSDPPAPEELSRAAATAQLALKPARAMCDSEATLACVGGTADTAARMLLAYGADDRRIAIVEKSDLSDLLKLVSSVPLAQRRRLRGLPEQRADIFPAGMTIFVELLSALGRERTYVSQSDLLLGYIARHPGLRQGRGATR